MKNTPPTTDNRQPTTNHLVVSLPRCLLALLLFLTACGSSVPANNARGIGGAVSPSAVTASFVEDLGKALQDPQIADDNARQRWVDTLADYFAPDEREAQRDALDSMLSDFATELKTDVNPGEEFRIELRKDGFKESPVSGQRALVEVVNGRIYWQVLRDGYQVSWDETPLSNIMGRKDVPTVKIGNAWFLSENYQ